MKTVSKTSNNNQRTIFVSRHKGASDWLAKQGLAVDLMVEHIELDKIKPDDCVIGSLPVHLASEICSKGGRYFHIVMNIPREARGKELTSADMENYNANIKEYKVLPIN